MSPRGPFSVIQNNGVANTAALLGIKSELLNLSGGTPPLPPIPPDEIPNLFVWYRDDDVTLSGSTVLVWNDKSGNGRNLTYVSPQVNPVYQIASGINGLNDLDCVQTTGGTISTAAAFDPTQGLSVFMVGTGKSIATLFPYISNLVSSAANVEFRGQIVPALAGYCQLTTSIVGQSTIGIGIANYYDTYFQTPHTLLIQYDPTISAGGADNPANWRFKINGVVIATDTAANALTTALGFNSMGAPNGTSSGGFGLPIVGQEFGTYSSPILAYEDGLEIYFYNRYKLGPVPMFATEPQMVVTIGSNEWQSWDPNKQPVQSVLKLNWFKRNKNWVIGASLAAAALAASALVFL